MSKTIFVVRVGNREDQDQEAFETLEGAKKHARRELVSRWTGCMSGKMPKDLETAIEEFSSMSSSFDQLEIIEMTLRLGLHAAQERESPSVSRRASFGGL